MERSQSLFIGTESSAYTNLQNSTVLYIFAYWYQNPTQQIPNFTPSATFNPYKFTVMFNWIIIFKMHQNITCIFLRLQRKQRIKYVHFVSDFRWSREASDFCACSNWSLKMATTLPNTIPNITEIKHQFLAMVPTRNLKLMVRASNDKHKETLWIFYLVVHNVLFIIINVFLEQTCQSKKVCRILHLGTWLVWGKILQTFFDWQVWIIKPYLSAHTQLSPYAQQIQKTVYNE